MATFKQKRAFTDEAIQDTLPSGNINLTHRPSEDLSSLIEAQASKPGIYTDPAIYDELSKISMDIHNTRRNSRKNDFDVKLTDYNYTSQEDILLSEINRQKELDNILLKKQTMFTANAADLIEKANRKEMSYKEVFGLIQNDAFSTLDEYNKTSPYLYDKFNSFAGGQLQKYSSDMIKKEYEQAERTRSMEINKSAGVFFTSVWTGEEPDVFTGLDKFIPQYLMSSADLITDDKDREAANTIYNQALGVKALQIKSAVESSLISVEQGKEAINNLIKEGASRSFTGEVNKLSSGIIQDATTALEEARNGSIGSEERTWDCYMEPETLEELLKIKSNLKDKKATMDFTAMADAHEKAIDATEVQKRNGSFIKLPYYSHGTLASAQANFNQMYAAVRPLLEEGDSSAMKQWDRIKKNYYQIEKPYLAAIEILRIQKGNPGAINKMIEKLNEIDPLDPGTHYEELIVKNEETGQIINLNYDHAEMGRPGALATHTAMEYYDSLKKALIDVRDQNEKFNNNGVLLGTNPTVNSALEKLNQALNPQAILLTNNKDGSIIENQEGVLNLTSSANTFKQAVQGFSNGAINPSHAVDIVTNVYKQGNNLDTKTREHYLYSVAKAFKSNPSMLIPANFYDLDEETRDTGMKLGVYTLLFSAPGGDRTASEIAEYALSGKSSTLEQLESKGKGLLTGNKGKNSPTKYLTEILADKEIPPEFRPLAKQLFVSMFSAHMEKNPEEKFDCRKFEKVLDANFTKGIYRHGTLYSNDSYFVSPEDSIQYTEETNKMVKAHLGGITQGVNVRSSVNQYNGKLTVEIDKQVVKSGGRPLQFNIEIPTGYEKEKYRKGIETTTSLGVAASVISGIGANSDVRARAYSIDPSITVEEWEKEAFFFVKTISDSNNQDRINKAMYNNWSDFDFVKQAPQYMKDLFFMSWLEGATGSFRYGVAKTAGTAAGLYANFQLNYNPLFKYTIQDDKKEEIVSNIQSGTENLYRNFYGKIAKAVPGSFEEYVYNDLNTFNYNIWDGIVKGATGSGKLEELKKEYKDDYERISKAMDAVYTLGSLDGQRVSMDIPKGITEDAIGINAPFISIESLLKERAPEWTVTSTTKGKHAPGTKSHGTGYKLDIGFIGGFEAVKDLNTGLPSVSKLRTLLQALEPAIKSGQIERINTGYTDLVHESMVDKKNGYTPGTRKEYEEFRNMKNSKGEPLFGHLNAHNAQGNTHTDHFDVVLSKQGYNPKTGKSLWVPMEVFMAESVKSAEVNINQKVGNGRIKPSTVKGLAYTWPHYTPTENDAKRMGVAWNNIKNNPYGAQLALDIKFIDLQNAFGNGATDLPIMALAGAKFQFIPENKNIAPATNLTGDDILNKYYHKKIKGHYIPMAGETKKKYAKYINSVVMGGRR